MPDYALKYGRNLYVGLIVRRYDLARWPVLPLVVGDLVNVLRQLVNRQAWPRIDGLPLHRAASRQDISGPLPLVVRATGCKAQIV